MCRSLFAVAPLAPVAALLCRFRFREVLTLGLVGDAGITSISSRVDQLLASRGEVPSEVTRNAGFELKEPLLVGVDIHRSSSVFGRALHGAPPPSSITRHPGLVP